MSKIINTQLPEKCKTWQAPNLEDSGSNTGRARSISAGHGFDSEEQKKIFQQSYEKGYREGLAAGQNEMNKLVGNIESIMAVLARPLPDVDDQVVDELVQLSMAVVKQMIRRELKISPGEIVAVVRDALSLLPAAATEVTLELHPDDAKLIREALAQPENASGWRISEDPLLTRGGCRVLTSTSRIDASVEKRINAVIAEVMGGERKMDAER